MRTLLYGSLAATLLALRTVPAHAERDPWSGAPLKPDKHRMTPSPITDRFAVRGTFFNPAITSSFRVDTQSGGGVPVVTGTTLSGERDFGMQERNPMGRIEIIFRLRERNRLRVDYFETNRRGDRVINRPIQLGNDLFQVNDEVTSFLDWRQFGLTYTYSVVRTDRIEAGIGLAVHFLQAEAQGEVVAKQLRQEVSGAGAFPTIPVDLTWRISRGFAVVARAQYFHTSVNNFDGSMAEYHGDFQYRWTPNFAIGAGYTTMRTGLAIKNDAHFPGAFHLYVRGPEMFVRASF